MSYNRADIEPALQHHSHFVPGLVHLAAVDALDRQHLENDLVPLDEIANTQEDVEKMIVLQTKIDTLAQLILDLMSFEWDEE